MSTSRLPGFHELSPDERRARLADEVGVDPDVLEVLHRPVEPDVLESLSENVVGRIALPIGVATNFIVDGEDVLVPMATEESSVVAAASRAAKAARPLGGFVTEGASPEMIAQVHIVETDVQRAQTLVDDNAEALLETVRDPEGSMEKRGGGPLDLSTEVHKLADGRTVLAVHLGVDVRDAMGANYVNELAERLAPRLEELTQGRALLRIVSNHATRRVVRAEATFSSDQFGGEQVVQDMVTANEIANVDVHRATTHNKGVLNGIIAVLSATGNETRAQEAGAHAYAAEDGRYRSLTEYEVTDGGDLRGRIEVPVQAGVVGGAAGAHPQARAALQLMGSPSGPRFARIAASVGLAQNAAALRALVDEGIQEGHMALHAANLARQAGVPPARVDEVAEAMVEAGEVSESAARRIASERGLDVEA